MRLQERLDAISKAAAERIPAEMLEGMLKVMHGAVSDLRDSGILERMVGVGDLAPPFSLTATSGETVALEDVLARGPLILGFYRGRW